MKRYTVKLIAAAAKAPAEILVHGPIGKSFWSDEGISAKEFTDALNQIPKGQPVTVGINSQGGAIGEGLAIYNAIHRRRADVTVRIDGYAMSAASFLGLAASRVVSPKTAVWMIHKGWSFAQGNADEMRKQGDLLDTHDKTMAAAYMAKTGKSEKEIMSAMGEETWLTGEEAIEWGLADEESENEPQLDALDFSTATATTFRNLPSNAPVALAQAAAKGDANTSHQQPNPPVTAAAAISHTAPTGAATTKQENTMNRNEIIALLKSWGVTVADNATDEWLKAELAKGKPTPASASMATATAIDPARFAALEAQLERERKERITRALHQHVVDGRLTNDELEDATKRALADEAYLGVIAKRPQVVPGDAPMGTRIVGGEKVAVKAIKDQAMGRARRDFIRDNWHQLQQGVRILPVYAANTMDSTALTTDLLVNTLITVLQNRLPALAGFTRDFGTDRLKPNAELQIPIATAGGTAQTNATDFEDTTNFVGTIDNVAVTVARITSGAHITPAELNNGFRMAQFAEIKASELADKIQTLVNAVITEANFTATPVVSAAAAFGQSEMNQLWALIAKSASKNIMLHQDYYKQLLPGTLENFNVLANNIPGWDLVALNTNWTGVGANIVGFACNPQAIAVGAGLPLASPNRGAAGTLAQTITVPGIALSVEQQEWFSNKTKTDWMNWEVIFGAAKGDGSAAALLKSA